MEPSSSKPTVEQINLAREQMEQQRHDSEHYRAMGLADMDQRVLMERANLALDAYRRFDDHGIAKYGEIISRDEVRAVVLAALGLPSAPRSISVSVAVSVEIGYTDVG